MSGDCCPNAASELRLLSLLVVASCTKALVVGVATIATRSFPSSEQLSCTAKEGVVLDCCGSTAASRYLK